MVHLKICLIAHVGPWLSIAHSAESWPKTPFISFHLVKCVCVDTFLLLSQEYYSDVSTVSYGVFRYCETGRWMHVVFGHELLWESVQEEED